MVTFLKDTFGPSSYKRVKPRLLHERSHLALEFPQPDARFSRAYIPFLENARISEKGRANLNAYSLVGRAGELFSYGGARSIRLSLSFNISLLHVIEMNIKEGIADYFKRQFTLFFEDPKKQESLFNLRRSVAEISSEMQAESEVNGGFVSEDTRVAIQDEYEYFNTELMEAEEELNAPGAVEVAFAKGIDYAATHRAYYREKLQKITGTAPDEGLGEYLTEFLGDLEVPFEQSEQELGDVINLVYCWVNLVRASVLNRSDNTTYGPPIVRLTHGPMYNNVPCLVEGYSININEEAGYELNSLTPKRLEITMDLVESRNGNYGGYISGQLESGDNLTGWESIISENAIDPFNGLIRESRQLGNPSVTVERVN